ncbi:DNA repair protein RecO [Gracilibacillus oryzae]|uniref:DNA repair protein RecO n=1 Tax=Gracilibacillus oryzae TaxID=1672701 RepID=A0A7C8GSA0_9BACI|nr:DNA repair protein RecO [Gracilibacillus oryzae]KAB8128736.1 DNA repair protein RecO [Gracilibacillus oryzae]
MFEKVEGIILKTQDYGETHKIVTLLTPTMGKFGAIARGAKKTKSRMAAITQPFIHGSFLVQPGSGLATIQQGEVIHSFRKIREDIFLTAYTSFLAELTDKVLDPKQYDPLHYKQLLQTLEWFEQDKDPEILTMIYEWKMYQAAGFAPIVDNCVNCGRKEKLSHFSIQEGGILCQFCHHKDSYAYMLNENLYKLLRIFSWVSLDRIGNISVKEENKAILKQIMDQYYERYGGYFLKSKRFLKQMDNLRG